MQTLCLDLICWWSQFAWACRFVVLEKYQIRPLLADLQIWCHLPFYVISCWLSISLTFWEDLTSGYWDISLYSKLAQLNRQTDMGNFLGCFTTKLAQMCAEGCKGWHLWKIFWLTFWLKYVPFICCSNERSILNFQNFLSWPNIPKEIIFFPTKFSNIWDTDHHQEAQRH